MYFLPLRSAWMSDHVYMNQQNEAFYIPAAPYTCVHMQLSNIERTDVGEMSIIVSVMSCLLLIFKVSNVVCNRSVFSKLYVTTQPN